MLHRPRIGHLVAAFAVALSVGAFPASRVAACSCAGFSSPVEGVRAAVEAGQLVFIGTVTEATGARAEMGGQQIRYAFAVEASSQPTGEIVEVSALGGDGGSACGIEFGRGERWAVAADFAKDAYSTHLCNANVRLDSLEAEQAVAVEELLTARPTDTESGAGDVEIPVELLIVGAGIAIVGIVSALAFRRQVN